MKKKAILLVAVLSLASIFCSLQVNPVTSTSDNRSEVGATLTALAVPAPTTSPSLLSTMPMSSFPDMGTISGNLSYPAESIPPLRIAAFELTTNEVSYTDTAVGQNSYTLDLPVGAYQVVAYTLGGGGFPTGLAGGYTQAVPCSLSITCTDHGLINVTVTAGTITPNVNPGDWYAPTGTFPPMPANK